MDRNRLNWTQKWIKWTKVDQNALVIWLNKNVAIINTKLQLLDII